MGGLRHLTASRAGCRCACGISIGDTLAALHGVIGVLTALHHRNTTAAAARSSTWRCTKPCST
jgi:crotonobetainyl-CoA:carnitine CoA-transferase CaiB-like acyl-CoA transferase